MGLCEKIIGAFKASLLREHLAGTSSGLYHLVWVTPNGSAPFDPFTIKWGGRLVFRECARQYLEVVEKPLFAKGDVKGDLCKLRAKIEKNREAYEHDHKLRTAETLEEVRDLKRKRGQN